MDDSKFIQLTDYCLLEYIFADRVFSNARTVDETIMHIRKSSTGINQLYYADSVNASIRNVQDVSAVYIGDNKFVHNDSEQVPRYTQYDQDIEETAITGPYIPYDMVRFHFMSGFSFDEFDALILSVANQQNNSELNYFSNVLVDHFSMAELVSFNPRPIFLTDTLYDRYIEYKVPSIYHLNAEYYGQPSELRGNTMAARLTPTASGSHSGFVNNAPIRVSIHECVSGHGVVNEDDEKIVYRVVSSQDNRNASIPQSSRFGNLGAEIHESADGDYVEYYATESGQFVEDFLGQLGNANPNDDWIIIHQLSVFEQVGGSFLLTKRFIDVQEDEYDVPNTYRPVLKYSDTAVSFSIDYMYRFLNRRNGEQVLKYGSMSSMNVKKYGRKTSCIKLDGSPGSHRIYNRVFNSTKDVNRLFVEPTLSEPSMDVSISTDVVERRVYIPVFFDSNKVHISGGSNWAVDDPDHGGIIYAQNELPILVTPNDNNYVFTFHKRMRDGTLGRLDLSDLGGFSMVFMSRKGGKIRVDMDDSSRTSRGELRFKLREADAGMLDVSRRDFYIVNVKEDGHDTFYTGRGWYLPAEMEEVRQIKQSMAADAADVSPGQPEQDAPKTGANPADSSVARGYNPDPSL